MGRPGITYNQVAEAAQKLKDEGIHVALPVLRERLGRTGSMNTIQRHMKAWEANQPKAAAPLVELPEEVERSMNAWVIQASTASRADAETEMLRAQAEADLLAQNGIEIEAEMDALAEQVALLSTERDQAVALAKERAEELERMARDLERERQVANAAQVATAASQLRLESQAQQLVDLKADVIRLNGALDAERQAHGLASTAAAVLQVELNAARKEADAERQNGKALQGKLDDVRAEEQSLRDELGQQLQEVAVLKAELNATRKAGNAAAEYNVALQAQLDKALSDTQALRDTYENRIQDLDRSSKEAIVAERVAMDKVRTEAHVAALQVADLRAKLGIAEEKIARMEADNKNSAANGQ